MTRIETALQALKEAGEGAFVPFITAGDPDLETTEQLVYAMAEAGADVIELGIPFSDPTAEGPVIQAANLRALSNGTAPDDVIELVRKLRKRTDVPIVFMTYANVVFSRGTQRFLDRAAEAGVDGLILADVPFEEHEFAEPCERAGIDLIEMVAPTSEDRIGRIARATRGFLYCVSSLGVTGVRSRITTDIAGMVRQAKAAADVPCLVGFGISTPDQARQMVGEGADGVIVGSAIVKIVAAEGRACVPRVAEYVRSMKDAARG